MKGYIDLIPPEQMALIVGAIVTLSLGLLTAIGFLIRWGVRYFARTQDEKLNAIRQERELEKAAFDAKQRQYEMEVQARLDETHSDRELRRLLMAQLDEERKDSAEQRRMWERFLEESNKIQREFLETNRGIQANTAGTFEMLKVHKESDDISMIRLENLKTQNDKTHEQNSETHKRISDLSQSVDVIRMKVDDLAASQRADKDAIIQSINSSLESLKSELQRLEENITRELPTVKLPDTTLNAVTSFVAPPNVAQTVATVAPQAEEKDDETE